MSEICRPPIVCPYLLVSGKCSLDETGNTICMEENKSWVCEDGKQMIAKGCKKKMTTFERLQKKIKEQTGIRLEGFRRTRAGGNALAQGGSSWEASILEDGQEYSPYKIYLTAGSQYTATELLKAKEIVCRNFLFFPKE